MSVKMAAPLLSTQQIRHFTAPVHLRVKCKAKGDMSSNSSLKIQKKDGTERNNVVLKIAWYASELYGMAAAVLQPSRPTTAPQELITADASGSVDRAAVVAAIVQDFLSSYVVTGNVTSGAYEKDCEFEDPILSFKGLQRFKRNCTNFGFLVLKSNLKFTKWEDFEDKGIAHWEFSFVLSLPWTPLLSTTGCTEFHFDAESGKVCRHIEKRDVPIMMLFKQIFMPSRYSDRKGEKGKSKLTTEVAAEMTARVDHLGSGYFRSIDVSGRVGLESASALQPSRPTVPVDEYQELTANASGTVDRAVVVDAIKQDFQRSYFVTGNLTLGAYEEDCEFADPAGSFKGLRRFKRNCTNFGSLIIKSNMKLMKWEDLEDKGIGHWRFSCVLSFPWRPILSATGYTEYYFDDESGKVIRHVENWNVPKMTLLKQILKPSGYNDRKGD